MVRMLNGENSDWKVMRRELNAEQRRYRRSDNGSGGRFYHTIEMNPFYSIRRIRENWARFVSRRTNVHTATPRCHPYMESGLSTSRFGNVTDRGSCRAYRLTRDRKCASRRIRHSRYANLNTKFLLRTIRRRHLSRNPAPGTFQEWNMLIKRLSDRLRPLTPYRSAERGNSSEICPTLKIHNWFFVGRKQKVFLKQSGQHGLDLINPIEEQIRRQSSEH